MGGLVGLRGDRSGWLPVTPRKCRELEERSFDRQAFLLPSLHDDLDGFLPLRSAVLISYAKRHLLQVCRPSRSPFDSATGHDVRSGDALSVEDRASEGVRGQCDTEPQPHILGNLGQGPDHYFGSWTVRPTLS